MKPGIIGDIGTNQNMAVTTHFPEEILFSFNKYKKIFVALIIGFTFSII